MLKHATAHIHKRWLKSKSNFMKFCTFIFFLFLVSCSHYTQNLTGKWQFVDFYNYQDPDTAKQNQARIFWTQYKMSFEPNNQYNSEGIFTDSGKWNYNEKKKAIKLIYNTGNEEILKIIELDSKKLIITFPDNKGLVFKRISSK